MKPTMYLDSDRAPDGKPIVIMPKGKPRPFNSKRALSQLYELSTHLNIPKGNRSVNDWALAVRDELQRRLDAGEPMPPRSRVA